jgi:hypothetical protein
MKTDWFIVKKNLKGSDLMLLFTVTQFIYKTMLGGVKSDISTCFQTKNH